MYVISKQQNKKILVVRLYQNAKTHVLCYNADLLSSPSPNPQGLASTKTQSVPRGLDLTLLTKSNKITYSTLMRKVAWALKHSLSALYTKIGYPNLYPNKTFCLTMLDRK